MLNLCSPPVALALKTCAIEFHANQWAARPNLQRLCTLCAVFLNRNPCIDSDDPLLRQIPHMCNATTEPPSTIPPAQVDATTTTLRNGSTAPFKDTPAVDEAAQGALNSTNSNVTFLPSFTVDEVTLKPPSPELKQDLYGTATVKPRSSPKNLANGGKRALVLVALALLVFIELFE
ncbi:hypothetical protein AC1031_005093 [Aphanomyces cochlioides]|nr:hypothetical protein AC1031_005093 [Aphanomyces cochlioides]